MNGGTKLATCLIVSIFLLGMTCPAAAGRTIYVDADASGANDGSSWANAFNYLQDALTDANSALKPVEIRVAEGIYTPDSNSADPNGSGDRTATFQLINVVTINGGYAGFGSPDPNARDVVLYETILSGDLDGNDIDINDIDANDQWELWKEPSRAENSYHIVTAIGTDETTVLDGFTITSGNANGRYNTHESLGGGMYTDSGGATVMNCTFSGNLARYNGGGMYSSSGVLKLINCTFRMNAAKESGGMEDRTSVLTLTNCTFMGNTASFGRGGMGIYDSNATITKCTFSSNKAGYMVGGVSISDGNVKLKSCTFIGNSVPWSVPMGGGSVGGLLAVGDKIIVTDCIFSGNSAGAGGGMVSGSGLTVTNCFFMNNSVGYIGGGILNYSRTVPVKITNCLFSGNSAVYEGGGIYNSEYYSSATLNNCTLIGNSAVNGGGGICNEYKSSATLTNCILWGNTASRGPQVEMRKEEIVTEVYYSCIEGGQAGIYDPYDGLVWGLGNIDVDPCFAVPGYWDPNGTPVDANDDFWVDGDYHLKSQAGRWDANEGRWTKDEVTSPCIDAGDPMSPIGLEPFPNSGRINMGAYGGIIDASKSYFGEPVCETIVAGDINGDCKVNFLDFRLMALHWLEDITMVNSNAMVDAGIEYYVQTSKSVYTLGENVEMLFRVTNLTGEDVLIPCGGIYEFNFFVKKNGETIWMEVTGMVDPSPGVTIMDGESIETGHNWNMKDNNGNPVGPGVYNVVGVMYNGPTEVEVTITIIP